MESFYLLLLPILLNYTSKPAPKQQKMVVNNFLNRKSFSFLVSYASAMVLIMIGLFDSATATSSLGGDALVYVCLSQVFVSVWRESLSMSAMLVKSNAVLAANDN